MFYTTSVDKTIETLEMLLADAEAFEREKVLAALLSVNNKFSIEEVNIIIASVKENRYKLEREVVALQAFSKEFLYQYATNHNKCYETAEILFNKMRLSIAGTKRLYKKFCATDRRPAPIKEGMRVNPSVFTNSKLSSKVPLYQLIDFECYDNCVNVLCDAMEDFYRLLSTALLLCRGVIEQEEEIRKDYNGLKKIYDSCREGEIKNMHNIVITALSQTIITDDELTRIKANANSLQEFICDGYHKVDKKTFNTHCILMTVKEGRRNGLTELESILWRNNHSIVPFVRSVIAHFDELNPKGYADKSTGKYKFSAKHVAMFMEWCQITGSGKEKQFIEEYFNKEYNGEYQCVNSSSVNAAKTKYTDEEYKQFKSALDALVGIEKSTEDTQRQVI